MIRTLALGGLLLAALVVGASAQDTEPKRKAKVYKTPQEVFEAVLAARQKRDARAMVDCFTPEAVKRIATDLAVQSFFVRDRAEGKYLKDQGKDKIEEEAKKLKPQLDVLDKHGLTEKATKDLRPANFRATKEQREGLRKLIKDPEAFVVEFMTAQAKAEPRPPEGKDDPKPKLADVKTDGDKGTGNVVVTLKAGNESKEIKQPVLFRKVNDGWRIDPQPEKEEQAPKGKDAAVKDKAEK
jgi:hypothetical protein